MSSETTRLLRFLETSFYEGEIFFEIAPSWKKRTDSGFFEHILMGLKASPEEMADLQKFKNAVKRSMDILGYSPHGEGDLYDISVAVRKLIRDQEKLKRDQEKEKKRKR